MHMTVSLLLKECCEEKECYTFSVLTGCEHPWALYPRDCPAQYTLKKYMLNELLKFLRKQIPGKFHYFGLNSVIPFNNEYLILICSKKGLKDSVFSLVISSYKAKSSIPCLSSGQ